MLIFWVTVFVVSLIFLVKGADWLLEGAENIGLAAGLSPFIVGVTIVGLGTSFPELFSSLAAVFRDATEIVVANAVGSNISNILLIIGLSAVFGRRLSVTKNLIDIDLPLLAASTVLFLGVVWDRQVVFFESLLLIVAFGIYLLYTVFHRDETVIPEKKKASSSPKLTAKDFLLVTIGVIGLVLGARYLIDSVITLSEMLNIATGVIAITAVAIGTSLPELLVSAKAALRKKSDVALGNIFGSNVFNVLMVIGFPGLFRTLVIDVPTFTIGVPVLAVATALFIVSGISKRIHVWEGAFYLLIYVVFIGKLFNLF